MKLPQICICICTLLLSSLSIPMQAQDNTGQTEESADSTRFQGVQYTVTRKATYKEQPIFCGVSVGADLAGALMAQFAKFGQYEAQARFNFKQRYFVAVEAGVGTSNHTNQRTDQTYKVHAPYFRIGADYNFANNPVSGNRIYAGLRYGFSRFNFNISGPAITDEVWGGTIPYDIEGIPGAQHWAELVAGLEGRLWRFIHLGWTARWKFRIHERSTPYGQPAFVPGYGNNSGSTCFGGSFSLLFDISDIKNSKKQHKPKK